MKALIDRTAAQWLTIKNKELPHHDRRRGKDTVMDCTLECFRGLAKCLEGSVERGVIYGKGKTSGRDLTKPPRWKLLMTWAARYNGKEKTWKIGL